jgi:hypothetical protein
MKQRNPNEVSNNKGTCTCKALSVSLDMESASTKAALAAIAHPVSIDFSAHHYNQMARNPVQVCSHSSEAAYISSRNASICLCNQSL